VYFDDNICIFNVFAVDSNFFQGVKRVFGSDDKKQFVDPYLQFSFAGAKVSNQNDLINRATHS
jgi:hypothetical protein